MGCLRNGHGGPRQVAPVRELATEINLAMGQPRTEPLHGSVAHHGPHTAVYCRRCKRWLDVLDEMPGRTLTQHLIDYHLEVK